MRLPPAPCSVQVSLVFGLLRAAVAPQALRHLLPGPELAMPMGIEPGTLLHARQRLCY